MVRARDGTTKKSRATSVSRPSKIAYVLDQ